MILGKRILLTGASGFVGKRYLQLSNKRYEIHPFSVTGSNIPKDEWLASFDTVVHMGGLAHQMQKVDPQNYFDANYEKTRTLALLAKKNGVKHFIFISTIKVFGESQETILTEKSPCLPIDDPYGESKLKAEEFLKTIMDEYFIVTIIRPPLVYGPDVKGNLQRLLNLCDSGYYLPFGSINNRRSMIFVDNLIELINHLIDTGTGGLFLAGDDRPVSTEELVIMIRQRQGKPKRLFAIPFFARYLLKSIKPMLAIRLFGSLEMDSVTSYKKINFVPPYSIADGVSLMVDAYMENKTK